MPLDMARRAAIPLPAPRSAAAGGRRSETRQEFSPRSQSGTSRRSRRGKRPPPGRGRAGDRSPWSSWRRRSSPGSRAVGLASEAWLEAAARRASGRPRIMPGQDSGAGPGRSFRHREGMGEPAAAKSRQRPSEGLAGHMAKRGKRDSPARVKVRKRRDAEGERSPRARAGRKGANEGDGRIATVMSSDESQELTIDPVGPWISGARP